MDKLGQIFGGAKDLGAPAAGPVPVTDQQLAGALQFQIGFQTAALLAGPIWAQTSAHRTFNECFEQALDLLISAQEAYPGLLHSALLRRQAEAARAAEAAKAQDGAE